MMNVICSLVIFVTSIFECNTYYTKNAKNENNKIDFYNNVHGIYELFWNQKNMLLYDNLMDGYLHEILNIFNTNLYLDIYHIETDQISIHTMGNTEKILSRHAHFNQIITVMGSDRFIETVLRSARNIDTSSKQHDVFAFSCKWILWTFNDCDAFLDSLQPFYNVICILLSVSQVPTPKINFPISSCCNKIQMEFIGTLVYGVDAMMFQKMEFIAGQRIPTEDYVFPNLKYRLNSRHFRIGTQRSSIIPFNVIFDETLNQTTYQGKYMDIMNEVAGFLNMTFTVVMAPRGQWGHLFDNGSWSGIIGQLDRGEVDIAIAPLSITYPRRQAVDFADFALEDAYYTGVYRKPPNDVNTLVLILSPFKPESWMVLGISVIVFSVILTILESIWLFRGTMASRIKFIAKSLIPNAYKSFHSFFGEEISIKTLKALFARIIWSTWLCFGMILVCLWSANIISFLTLPNYDIPFETMEQLYQQDSYKYGTRVTGTVDIFFATSKRYPYKQMWERMKKWDKDDDDILDEGGRSRGRGLLHKALTENYVFFYPMYTSLGKVQLAPHCNIEPMKDVLYKSHIGMAVQKNSAYKDLINQASLWLLETGIMSKLNDKWRPKHECPDETIIKQNPISVAHTSGIFYAIAGGCVASIIVFVLEQLVYTFISVKRRHFRN